MGDEVMTYKRRYNIEVETPLWWEHDIDEENKEWEREKETDDNKSDKDETKISRSKYITG